jgi:hypothetical protein
LVNPTLVEKLLDNNEWINIEYNHLNIQMNNYVRRQMNNHVKRRRFGSYYTDSFQDENDIYRDIEQQYDDRLIKQYMQEEFVQRYQRVFFWSCEYGHKKILENLLKNHQHKFDIDRQDSYAEQTGLIMACLNTRTDIAELLIEYGADSKLKDKNFKTCFDYLKLNENDVDHVEKLKDLYLKFKNTSESELKKFTLKSLLKDYSTEEGFFIKPEYFISFELINETLFWKLDDHSLFIVYFVGYEFQEKLTRGIIKILKDFQEILKSQMPYSLFELLETYSINIPKTILGFDLMPEQTRSRFVSLIDDKLSFIDKFKRIIEKKRQFLVRWASLMFNLEILDKNEIDVELKKYFEKTFVENYLKVRGFKATRGLITDEFLFFRALSDQFYGDQKYFLVIQKKLSQHLGIDMARVDQRLEIPRRFQEFEILRAFSLIYECKINVHQLDTEHTIVPEKSRFSVWFSVFSTETETETD